jgi:hypothetical protein
MAVSVPVRAIPNAQDVSPTSPALVEGDRVRLLLRCVWRILVRSCRPAPIAWTAGSDGVE